MKRVLLTLVSGSALAIAPLTYATVVVPATSHADECTDAEGTGAADNKPCGSESHGLNCPDGTIVDDENKQCVDLMSGISKQLQALPAPPSLAGGGGGLGGLGSFGGIPSLGTINAPDLVLPSLGLGLVPNLQVNLQPQFGGVSAPTVQGPAGVAAALPNLAQLPAPQLPPPPDVNPLNPLGLPPPPSVNPLNPLGLPPPPDLTPGIPFI
jgi:hypothetical protein